MDFSSVRSSVRSHSLLLSCSSSKRRLSLHAKIAQYRSCPFFFADNSANHFLDSAMILRALVVDGGYGSLLKAGFCPAFAVQRKLAFFSACLVAVKLLPLGFVNCNLNQQVCASSCGLEKKSSANCSSMSVVQYMPSWCRKWGHVLDSENKARIYWASCEIMNCIAVLNNEMYTVCTE